MKNKLQDTHERTDSNENLIGTTEKSRNTAHTKKMA